MEHERTPKLYRTQRFGPRIGYSASASQGACRSPKVGIRQTKVTHPCEGLRCAISRVACGCDRCPAVVAPRTWDLTYYIGDYEAHLSRLPARPSEGLRTYHALLGSEANIHKLRYGDQRDLSGGGLALQTLFARQHPRRGSGLLGSIRPSFFFLERHLLHAVLHNDSVKVRASCLSREFALLSVFIVGRRRACSS